MKRFIMILAAFVGLTTAVMASDTYAHDANVLPEAAKTTINNNFKSKVSLVKIDKTLGHIDEYEVILTDGTEITFDNKGNWKEVETSQTKSVPQAFIPQAIRSYVNKNHAGQHIVGIEKKRKGYEVELTNGIDIKFKADGTFDRYDK